MIYLASFLQKENFGPGRLISITENGKPRDIEVGLIFKPFTPPYSLVQKYNNMRVSQPKEASDMFVAAYIEQLDAFMEVLKLDAQNENKTMVEMLPFQDGDTLVSWERAEYTNYRKILAPYLEKMGFEINLA